jgi:glycerophosphoryl diester phosphodiesterase
VGDTQAVKQSLPANDRRIIRIGHRGAAGHAPENTIAAIRMGISLGADFVEVDVQRTRDGHLVVIHDATVDRTTDGKGKVCDMTWNELQLLDAGAGERIPSVEAVLAAANGHAGVMLEAKARGIGTDLYRAVQASGFSGPVIYASFLHAEIVAIRAIDPLARTLALMDGVPPLGAAFADGIASMVGMDNDFTTAEFITTLHDAGLEVWLYTVNEPALIQRAIDLGADGIISDYPERVPKNRLI